MWKRQDLAVGTWWRAKAGYKGGGEMEWKLRGACFVISDIHKEAVWPRVSSGVLADLHVEAGFDINYPKQLSWHCPQHAWYEDSVCSSGGQMDITSICREQHYVKPGGWSRRPFVFIWRQCSLVPRTKTGCDWEQGRVFPRPRTVPTSTLTALKEIRISLWVWRRINSVASALR